LFISGRNAQFMILYSCIIAEDKVLPVRAFTKRSRISESKITSGGYRSLIEQRGVFRGVQQIEFPPWLWCTNVPVVIDSHLPRATFLGRDDDNAIRRACTIDGGRCRVLKHFDRLDIRLVEIFNSSADLHTVYDVQRIAVTDRSGSADADRRRCTGLTGVRGDG